ncbi:MAG: hypothetical protein HY808_14260 [Nitrospirae bacterium]|nr:hypothetical protein [Nitrospirota bacterium]
MKKKRINDIYFHGADDRDVFAFTEKFLVSGLFWIYIAINSGREWKQVYEKLSQDNKPVFRNEYNKALLICNTYKNLSKLFLKKELHLKNLFLLHEDEILFNKLVKLEKADESRWKEALELAA